MTYNCNDKTITICDLDKKTNEIQIGATNKCCSSSSLTTYYNEKYCSSLIEDKVFDFLITNVTVSPDYDENLCLGYMTWNWEFTTSLNIDSVIGVVTYNNLPHDTINSTSDFTGLEQVYFADGGGTYVYNIDIITIEGCSYHVKIIYTTEVNSQCTLGDPRVIEQNLNVVNDHVTNPFEIINGCVTLNIPMEDGVNNITLIVDGVDMSSCILVDCNSLECKITNKIADTILCTGCNSNIDSSFELYLKYQILLDLIDCQSCCNACELYNQLKDELSNGCTGCK